MKQCPACGQTFTDQNINFCLNDGELLTQFAEPNALASEMQSPSLFADDSPTVLLNSTRTTQPNWQQPIQPWQQGNQMQSQFVPFVMPVSINQTLAIVSMCLGIASLAIGWCCSIGLVFSPAALITGFIALSQIKKNPQLYGGRGFALAGIITGAVFLMFYVLFIIIYGLAVIGGSL